MTDTVDTAALDGILASIFLTAEAKQDPYPGYAAVREAAPVHRTAFGPLLTARYDECNRILRDNRFGRGEQEFDPNFWGLSLEEFEQRFPRRNQLEESMLGLDPPDHTRLRGLVAKAFTPNTVKALEPRIKALTDRVLEPLEGDVDVMPDLALKLPITVISEMLGVPDADHDMLVPHIKVAVGGLATFQADLEKFTAIYDAGNAISDYFTELVEEKRSKPGDDVLTALLHAEEEGDKLTHPELLSTVILLFVAGYETTTNLIGNGLRALLLHPEQLERLRHDRGHMKTAIEEMLRWDSPVQGTARTALEDGLEVGGQPVPKGEQVLFLFGGANRDPRAYGDDADAFDITRTGPAPVSFSAGIHYCLGAALARAEGSIVFDSLLDRYTTIEPAWTELTYRDNFILRGLEALPVRLEVA